MVDLKQHNAIDGCEYRKLVISAAQLLHVKEEEINELNVFSSARRGHRV